MEAPRILILLANPWVSGDATVAAAFASQLGVGRTRTGPAKAEVSVLGQSAAAPILARAGLTFEALSPDPDENERRLKSLAGSFSPDLVLVAERRNFLDQFDPRARSTGPFVPNLRWESIVSVGRPLATFDNLPGDRAGQAVREEGMPVVVPVPPLDPGRLARLGGEILAWNALPDAIADTLPPPAVRRKRLQVLLTLSEWSARLALERGLGFYYLLLERQLVSALERLGRPVSLLIAGGPARFFQSRTTGSVRIRTLGPLGPARFERLLFGADLLLTDHALQFSLARRVRAGRPALLVRQTLRWQDRDRTPFVLDAQAAHLLELWVATRPDTLGPWDIFPLEREPGLLDAEPFFDALPKADLLDSFGLERAMHVLLGAEARTEPVRSLDALYARVAAMPLAPEIVARLVGQR